MNGPPDIRYRTTVPRELTNVQGIPVFPPVRLGPGDGVDLWYWVADGELSLRHAGSSLEGARYGLLYTLRERTMRLVGEELWRLRGRGNAP